MQTSSIIHAISYSSIDTLCSASTEPCTPQKKYSRISQKIRNQLFDLIFFNGKKIKEAAQQLKINYSSAKTILHLYRKKFKKQIIGSLDQINSGRCSYRTGFKPIEVVCSRGGRMTMCQNIATKFIAKHKIEVVKEKEKSSLLNIHKNTAFKFCTKVAINSD